MSTVTDSQVLQIKRLAPFLDSHVLLQFLKNHVPGTQKLQDQIQERTLISKSNNWDKVDDEHKAENN